MTLAPKSSSRMNKADWIEAAMRLLVEGGPEALRVDRLCLALGITKGSFYWHFASRDALIEAMAADWAERRPAAALAEAEQSGTTPAERLDHLAQGFWRDDIVQYDAAMRAWGVSEPRIRAAIETTDRQITAYVQSQFEAMGATPAETRARALILFYCSIGISAAPYLLDKTGSDVLGRMNELMTGQANAGSE